MRPLLIAGVLLLAFGAFVLLRGGSFTTRKDVLKVGDVQITADERQSIPTWVGGLALLAGLGLIVGGAQKRGG